MSVVGSAFVEVLPDMSHFGHQLEEGIKGTVEHATSSSSSNFDKLASVGKAAFLGLGAAAVAFGVEAIHAALEGQKAHELLVQTVDNTGTAFESVGPRVDKLSERFAKFGYQNDEVEGALTRLVQTTGDTGKSIDLMGLAADVAAARHMDLTTAAQLVGKVAEGNVAPLKKLTGITVEGATAAEKAANGLALMNERFGGSAQSQAETYAGKMAAFRAETQNLTEKVGNFLLPVLADLVTAGADVVNFFEHNQAAAIALAVAVGGPLTVAMTAFAIAKAQALAEDLGKLFDKAAIAAYDMVPAIGAAAVAFGAVLLPVAVLGAALYALGVFSDEATDKAKKVGEAYAKDFAAAAAKSGDNVTLLTDRIASLTLEQEKVAASARAHAEAQGFSGAALENTTKVIEQQTPEYVKNQTEIKKLQGEIDKITQEHKAHADALKASTDAEKIASSAGVELAATSESLAAKTGITTEQMDALAKKLKIDVAKANEEQIAQLTTMAERLTTTSPVVLELTDAMAKYSDKTADAGEKSKAFKSALDLLIGGEVPAEQAVVNLYNQIDTLGQKLTEGKGSLDLHAAAGRNDISAIDDTVVAIRNHIESMQHSGASSVDMQKALEGDTRAFDDQLKKAGLTAAQIDELNKRYGLVPETINTILTADTRQAIADLQGVAEPLLKIFNVGTKGHPVKAFAEGGWVDAPPGLAIPAIVHGGEFVLSRDMLRGLAPSPLAGKSSTREINNYITAVAMTPSEILHAVAMGERLADLLAEPSHD